MVKNIRSVDGVDSSRGSIVAPKAIASAAPTTARIAHAAMPRRGAMVTSEAPIQSAPPHQKNDSAIQLAGEETRRGKSMTAAIPANAGAVKSTPPASVSASTRSGASVAAFRQSANVTLTTCSQNQIHPRCSRSSARSPAIATARSEDVNSENNLSTALSRMRTFHKVQTV
jgi:hypothetical protein